MSVQYFVCSYMSLLFYPASFFLLLELKEREEKQKRKNSRKKAVKLQYLQGDAM